MLHELMKDLVESYYGIMAVIDYGHCELCVLIYGFEPSGGVYYRRINCTIMCCIGFGSGFTSESVMTCRGRNRG